MTTPLDFGFLVFLNYRASLDAKASLEDGISLFAAAEKMGYGSGWVRVHHGMRTLSSPMAFLAAAARHTSSIRLGTAVVPVGYEDPLRLAEDAATTDLLSNGRLELGLSSGIGVSLSPEERTRVVDNKLAALRAALEGESLGVITEGPATGTPLIARPHSPGLSNRLWYGAGSVETALRAARVGLNLVLATRATDSFGPTLGHTQAEIILRYRDEFATHFPDRTPRVALGRWILPLINAEDRHLFGPIAERHHRTLPTDGRFHTPRGIQQASPLYTGSAEQIIDELGSDPSLALIDTLLLTPPEELDSPATSHILGSFAAHVLPGLQHRVAERSIRA